MRPTLLLLSLVAIALMSGTEAQKIWNGEQSFDEMDDGCTPDDFYSFISRAQKAYPKRSLFKNQPEWMKVCTKAVFNELCDECEDDVNCIVTRGAKVAPTVPECHQLQPRRLAGGRHPWNGEEKFDEQDDEAVGSGCRVYTDCDTFEFDELDDEEDECSTRNFDRVLVATVEITGRAPNPACARAVFDKICDQCEDNIQCYLKLGRQVGPETRQCQPRRLGGKGKAVRGGAGKAVTKFKVCTRFGGCKEVIRL
jgi:hypothetical protein